VARFNSPRPSNVKRVGPAPIGPEESRTTFEPDTLTTTVGTDDWAAARVHRDPQKQNRSDDQLDTPQLTPPRSLAGPATRLPPVVAGVKRGRPSSRLRKLPVG